MRTGGQTFIGCYCEKALIEALDAAVARAGGSRSLWLRKALLAELNRNGAKLPEHIIQPPPRLGKGGPKKKSPVGEHNCGQVGQTGSCK